MKLPDIASLLGAKVLCPVCNGEDCRPSRWRSKQEKLSYQEACQPYRCENCSHRFLSPNSVLLKRKLINFSAWAIIAVLFVVVPVSWFWDFREASLDDPEIAAVIEDPNDILAAGRGDAEAQRRVGEALLNHGSPGRGGVVYAVSWLQKAAEGGNVSAMVSLGKMLETGDRAPKDTAKAAMWMQMAAAAGELEGMLELGRMYRDGIGLGQDPVRAYVWLSRAGAGHNLEAIRERDELVRTLSPEKLQEAQNQSSENPAGSSAPVRSF